MLIKNSSYKYATSQNCHLLFIVNIICWSLICKLVSQVSSSQHVKPVSVSSCAFSLRHARISKDLCMLLRRPQHNTPQTVNILSTKACEAGAQSKSSATGNRRLYVADLCCQKVSILHGWQTAGIKMMDFRQIVVKLIASCCGSGGIQDCCLWQLRRQEWWVALMPVPYVAYVSTLYAGNCRLGLTHCSIHLHRWNLVFVRSGVNNFRFSSFCLP